MASTIIDRRPQTGKSAGNRQRILRRVHRQLKKQVDDLVMRRKLGDIEGSAEVEIQNSDVTEPTFIFRPDAGAQDRVLPGNDQYSVGDRIKKPQGGKGGGQGSGAGEGDGDGEDGTDSFRFMLSRDEFLSLLFDDLMLPPLVKSELSEVVEKKMRRGGIVRAGVPGAMSVVRTFRESLGRRVAAKAMRSRECDELDEEMYLAQERGDTERVRAIAEELHAIRARMGSVPFLDPVDLRYRSTIEFNKPVGAAVMFCLMDVSGSMDETRKELAKRFFTLLYLFLSRKYEKVELVFIRHTETAEECDEQTFFYDPKTGGTVVMSALQMMEQIIKKRYSSGGWTIFGAQCSDGDAWSSDGPRSADFLRDKLLPLVRYYVYAETLENGGESATELWSAYDAVAEKSNFNRASVGSREEVYPALAKLFSRERAEALASTR